MIDRVQRRLLLALVASVLLHLWIVRTAEGTAARRATAAGAATISATLQAADHAVIKPSINATPSAPSIDGAASQTQAPAPARPAPTPPESHPLPATEPGRAEALASRTGLALAAAAVSTKPVDTPQAVAAPEGTAVFPQLSDGTYYTARSLDVYPRALTALDLGPQASAGKARATVLIDESGTVNDVRAVEAAAADIASSMRDLLLRTRFTPASKDGRRVKAQLLVSVDYGADGRR